MSYLEQVFLLQQRFDLARIEAFVGEHVSKTTRAVVVLLPGGMGSELKLAERSIDEDPTPDCETIWVTVDALFRLARGEYSGLFLDGSGVDSERRPVIAEGALTPNSKQNPYPALRRRCRSEDIAVLDLGFDWRRSALDAAARLGSALKELSARLPANVQIVLLGHSQGGQVLHVFSEQAVVNFPGLWSRIRAVVYVGAPFWGTLDHLNRYFNGGFGSKFSDMLPVMLFAVAELVRSLQAGQAISFCRAARLGLENFRRLVSTLPGLLPLIPTPYKDLQRHFESLGVGSYPIKHSSGEDFAFRPNAIGSLLPAFSSTWTLARSDLRAIRSQPHPEHLRKAIYVAGVGEDSEGFGCELRVDLNAASTLLAADTAKPSELRAAQVVRAQDATHDGVVPIWSAIPAAEARARLIRIVGGEHRAMVGGSTVVSILDALAKASDLEQIIAAHDKRAEPASTEDESQSALWQMAEDDSPADKTAVVQAFATFLANG